MGSRTRNACRLQERFLSAASYFFFSLAAARLALITLTSSSVSTWTTTNEDAIRRLAHCDGTSHVMRVVWVWDAGGEWVTKDG